MTSLTVQAALIKDARGKEGSYQRNNRNTYIILPRYLFRNSFPFSIASEMCDSKGSMTYQKELYMDVACAR
jgi:hypothetical protein